MSPAVPGHDVPAGLERQVADARAAAVPDLGVLRKAQKPAPTRGMAFKLELTGPVWQLLGSDSPDTIDTAAVVVATGPAATYDVMKAVVADAMQTAVARAATS